MGFMVSPLPYVLLVGGLEHFEHFPFHIWDVIQNPLTNSYCSRWLKAPTRLFCSLSAQRTFGVFQKKSESSQ